MKVKPWGLIRILATLTIMSSALMMGGAVFADDGGDEAQAFAEANWGSPFVDTDHSGEGYATATVDSDADGHSWTNTSGTETGANVTAVASAIADSDSFAEVEIGYWYGEGFESGSGAYIDSSSTGTVVITGNAVASGHDAYADIEIDYAGLEDGSDGAISVEANATATGEDAEAIVEDTDATIEEGSTGTININANATATGTNSYAEVCELDIQIGEGSEGEVTAVSTANASNGGNANVETYASIYDSTSVYQIWTIANADGEGSYADSNVNLFGQVPAGAYVDVAADGNAIAIAFLVSDGTNVWAISYTDASNGGIASAFTTAGKEGTWVNAIVGILPPV